MPKNSPAANVLDLLNVLLAEHEPHHWYRGQSKEYPGPLLPSMYRRRQLLEKVTRKDDHSVPQSMRGIGRSFYRVRRYAGFADIFYGLTGEHASESEEETVILKQICHDDNVAHLVAQVGVEVALKQAIQKEIYNKYKHRMVLWGIVIEGHHRALVTLNGLTQYLGFRVGQTLAQHYVENSEYLDVTSSPEVACLFAAWGATDNNGVGIVYRFSTSDWCQHCSADFDYYSAPPLVNALNVLRELESQDRSLEKWAPEEFATYQALSGGERYWELLKLQRCSMDTTRVGMQRAGFLVPDEIRSEHRDAIGNQEVTYQAVEDLAERPGLKQFYFKHSVGSARKLPVKPTDLWPCGERSERYLLSLVRTIVEARSNLRRAARLQGKKLIEVPDPEMWFPERTDLIREKAPMTGDG